MAPGLVDTHSHFRDPGFTYKEDLHTGSLAAAAGGYTSVILMANTNPPVDSAEILTDILERGRREQIHIYSAANVTKGMKGQEVNDLQALAAAGAPVFTDDGKPILNEAVFTQALKEADALGIPVSLHEEDPEFIRENGINAGSPAARELGITGSDRQAEISMIARDTRIAAELGVRLLIQHISTKEGVDLVRQARKINPLIHAEATPQHFSLTEDAVLQTGSLAKVNPPLRTEEDRLAIIQGLQDGTIDIIATDHAPHSAEEKAITPLWNAPSGMIGLPCPSSSGRARPSVHDGDAGAFYLQPGRLLSPARRNPCAGGRRRYRDLRSVRRMDGNKRVLPLQILQFTIPW